MKNNLMSSREARRANKFARTRECNKPGRTMLNNNGGMTMRHAHNPAGTKLIKQFNKQ